MPLDPYRGWDQRLKVFKTLTSWLAEFRLYRRDEKGNVVKKMDHLMDATRYLVVSGTDRMVIAPDAIKRVGRQFEEREYNPHRRA